MIVSALVTGAILAFTYFFTRGFVHSDFIDRLAQQSSLEVLHYATPEVRDIMPAGSFNLIDPSTTIYSAEKVLLYKSGDFDIPVTWVNFLKENDVFNAERGPFTSVGRKHVINGTQYLVFVSDKDTPGEREMNFLMKAILAGWVVSLILSYLTGLYFSSNALKPVTRVVEEVNTITEGNLNYRLKLKKKVAVDEIDELILTFNALLSRIQRAFVAQRRFVQNASHELKTPLTAIMAEVELALARNRPTEEYQRTLQVVLQETDRLANITQGLLTLTRLEEGSHKTEMNNVHVENLLQETLSSFRLHHPEREVVRNGDAADSYVVGNDHLLQTALLNILDNAYKYSSDKINVDLKLEDHKVMIHIKDHGIGIPKSDIKKIKSPLYRGSNAHAIAGAGLGLSLVDRIVSVHSGSFEIHSHEGKGTECRIELPVV